MDKSGRSNGLYFNRKGDLISCADEQNELWSINPKGKVKVLLKDFEGKRFNGPNDLWIHPGALFERRGIIGNDTVNFLNTAFAAAGAFFFLKVFN